MGLATDHLKPPGAEQFPEDKQWFSSHEAAVYLGMSFGGFNYSRYLKRRGERIAADATRSGKAMYSRGLLDSYYESIQTTPLAKNEFTSKQALEYLGIVQATLNYHIGRGNITPSIMRISSSPGQRQIFTRVQLDDLKANHLRRK